jgi:DnaK suppressor protein
LTFIKDAPQGVIHHEAVTQKESTMDKQHATPYQQQLVAMRAALLAQMAAQRGGDIGRVEAASAHFSHSEESPAQMATEKEIEFAIGDHEVAELTAIEAALSRIEAGSYGECIACGVHIPAARLKATPEASRCIHCQEAYEKKHPA